MSRCMDKGVFSWNRHHSPEDRSCRNAWRRRHHGRDHSPEQAKDAEEAGACAVMALERIPADIRAAGGIARMADPTIVKRIMEW